MSKNDDPHRSLARELLDLMPPAARTVLLWLLVIPLGLALAGMILQINVGAIIQDAIKQSRGETVEVVDSMLAQRLLNIDTRLTMLDASLQGMNKRLIIVENQKHIIPREMPPVAIPDSWK